MSNQVQADTEPNWFMIKYAAMREWEYAMQWAMENDDKRIFWSNSVQMEKKEKKNINAKDGDSEDANRIRVIEYLPVIDCDFFFHSVKCEGMTFERKMYAHYNI